MVEQQERQLVYDRYKKWVESLSAQEQNLPFIHILGKSMSPLEALNEILEGSAIGNSLTRAELLKLGYLRGTL